VRNEFGDLAKGASRSFNSLCNKSFSFYFCGVDSPVPPRFRAAAMQQWRRQRVKEPGHFEVRRSSRYTFFLKKIDLFLVVALKTQAAIAVSLSK